MVAGGLALAPLLLLLADIAGDRLTANPVQEIEQQTGKAGYVLLLLSLAVTPASRLARALHLFPRSWDSESLALLRRVLGWSAMSWALGHFLVFAGLDYAFDPELLWGAVADKRFALVGLAALLLLAARAVTPRTWQAGRGRRPSPAAAFTPLAAALVALHYLWAVKTVTAKEIAYAVVTALLLGVWAVRSEGPRTADPPSSGRVARARPGGTG